MSEGSGLTESLATLDQLLPLGFADGWDYDCCLQLTRTDVSDRTETYSNGREWQWETAKDRGDDLV